MYRRCLPSAHRAISYADGPFLRESLRSVPHSLLQRLHTAGSNGGLLLLFSLYLDFSLCLLFSRLFVFSSFLLFFFGRHSLCPFISTISEKLKYALPNEIITCGMADTGGPAAAFGLATRDARDRSSQCLVRYVLYDTFRYESAHITTYTS